MDRATRKIIKEEQKALERKKKGLDPIKKYSLDAPPPSQDDVGKAPAPKTDSGNAPEEVSVDNIDIDTIVSSVDGKEKKGAKKDTRDNARDNASGNSSEKKYIGRDRKHRKDKIAKELELERNKYLGDDGTVQVAVPIELQKKFLYYTTSLSRMEKNIKRLRIEASLLLLTLIVFVSLYVYELDVTRRRYENMFHRSIVDVVDTLQGYMDNPIDGERYSRMLTGETNIVRMASKNAGIDDAHTNKLMDMYSMMVDYPQQMEERYEKILDIYKKLEDDFHDEEAYKMIDEIRDGIEIRGE